MPSQTFTAPGDNTWTAPAGVASVDVELWGGGGGGGNGTGAPFSGAGGGGGGEYGKQTGVAVTALSNYTAHVGSGGLAVTNGTDSTFKGDPATVYQANHGVKGLGTAGGTGGTGSNCAVHFDGGAGETTSGAQTSGGGGGSSAGTASIGTNGAAGSGGIAPTGGGDGGNGGASGGSGSIASSPGGGGGGGGDLGGSGGKGKDGKIILTWIDPLAIQRPPPLVVYRPMTPMEFLE